MAGVLAGDLAAGVPLGAAVPPARLSSAGAGAGWASFFPCSSKQCLYSLNKEGGPQWVCMELVTLAGSWSAFFHVLCSALRQDRSTGCISTGEAAPI